MVSGSILGGVVGFIGTVFIGYITAGLWIWRHRTNLDSEDHDRIAELENDQKSTFQSELADLYLTIEEAVEESDPPDEMPRNEVIVNAVSRRVDEADVEEIAEELEQIGQRREVYEDHESAFRQCYIHLFKASAADFGLGISLILSISLQSDPFAGGVLVVYGLLLYIMIDQSSRAFSDFQNANHLKESFDEHWRDYKTPE